MPQRSRERVFVVAYDIADDGRRARQSRFLESRGERVQWSVFELIVAPARIEGLIGNATATSRFDPAQDSLRCYPLCGECRRGVLVRGLSRPPTIPGSPLVL